MTVSDCQSAQETIHVSTASQTADVTILVYDAHGTILSLNTTGAQQLEWPVQTLIGKNVRDIATPHSGDQIINRIPLATVDHTDSFEAIYVSRTGRHLEVEVTTHAIECMGRQVCISVAHDITDRRHTITALQAAKDYAENIINSSLDIIVSVDTNRRIIEFNRAAQQAFGYSREEVLGKAVDLLYADTSEGIHVYQSSLTGGAFTGEIINKRKDGTTFDAYLSASVLRDGQGTGIGVMGISRDITERKRAEVALQAAKEAAEAANQAKNAFLASASHEIRTPMNGILGMTELALDTNLSPEQQEYLDMVKISAEALLRIINDLLDFSKIEAGKLVLDAHDFSLRAVLHDTMKMFALQAHQKGLELVYDVPPLAPDGLIGDAGRLRQILVNLVGNAIKFTTAGEVAVQVEVITQTIDEVCLQMHVRDTGIGIPETKQRQIFEPFSQADSSTTRMYGGTGLGLSIVSQLVTLMGGNMQLKSALGIGSTFSFTARFGRQRQASTSQPQTSVLKGVKVLVVDDNGTNRRSLHTLLCAWEMEPTTVENGQKALEVLTQAARSSQPFTMVILDAQMPGWDGFAVATRLRTRLELTHIPLIMMLSTVQANNMSHCQALGATACLYKPVAQAELWEAVVQTSRRSKETTPETQTHSHPASLPSRSLHLLLAEDNVVNQRLVLRLLEKRGHTVTVVQTGVEALAVVRQADFDLVLMDVQMPQMDGFEATAAIREREKDTGTHLPIVAMTAHAMQGDREACLAAGMDEYVVKPLRPETLFEVVERLAMPAPSGHVSG